MEMRRGQSSRPPTRRRYLYAAVAIAMTGTAVTAGCSPGSRAQPDQPISASWQESYEEALGLADEVYDITGATEPLIKTYTSRTECENGMERATPHLLVNAEAVPPLSTVETVGSALVERGYEEFDIHDTAVGRYGEWYNLGVGMGVAFEVWEHRAQLRITTYGPCGPPRDG